MSETPANNDPFEKRVAITIACIAAVLSVVSTFGENSQTDSIIKTNQAANKWSYFQSKSIKEHILLSESRMVRLIGDIASGSPIQKEQSAKLAEELSRYQEEKDQIKKSAEQLEKEATQLNVINQRFDLASLVLQLAIVLSSVAILAHTEYMWYTSITLGIIGSVIGITGFFL